MSDPKSYTRVLLTRVTVIGVGQTTTTSRTVDRRLPGADGRGGPQDHPDAVADARRRRRSSSGPTASASSTSPSSATRRRSSTRRAPTPRSLSPDFPRPWADHDRHPRDGRRPARRSSRPCSTAPRRSASIEDLYAHIQGADHEFAVVIGPSITTEDAADLRPVGAGQPPRPGRDPAAATRSTRQHSRWRCAAACARSCRARTSPASPRPSSGCVRSPAPSGRRCRARSQARCRAGQGPPHGRGARPSAAAAEAPQGKLFTVFSTKGGVGKSLVAMNTAVALAQQGHRVCLVDLDVNSGDVAIMLQLSPSRQRQRPRRLPRRHRRGRHRVAPHAALRAPLGRRGAGPRRLPRPGLRRGDRPAARRPQGDVRLRRRRHLGRLRRPGAGGARPLRHDHPGRHAGHPCAQGSQAGHQHARPAQLLPRLLDLRAQPRGREGRPHAVASSSRRSV